MGLFFLFSLVCVCCASEFSEAELKRVEYLESLVFPDESELWRAHFDIPSNVALPTQPPRFDSVSSSEFERFASLGRPFIVKSTVGNKDWSCEYLMERFPSVSVNPQPYDVDLNFDRSARLLGKMFDDGFAAPIRRSTPVQDPLDASVVSWFTPFEFSQSNKSASVTIENELRLPSFVENSELNKQSMKGRFEFFMGAKNSGLNAHTDPQCQWIMTSQFSGSKNWRLAISVNLRQLFDLNPTYDFAISDITPLQAIQLKRNPLFDFDLGPGDLLFFPPGIIHATRVVSDVCSLSMSVALGTPTPVQYVRTFHENLGSDLIMAGRCFVESWNKWLFGEPIPPFLGEETFVYEQFRKMDEDGSGVISHVEALRHFSARYTVPGLSEDANVVTVKTNARFVLAAENFISVHDTNSDKVVTGHEFAAVYYSMWYDNEFFRRFTLRALHWLHLDEDQDDLITHSEILRLFPSTNLTDIPDPLTYEFYDQKIEFLHSKLTASESIPLATKTFSDSLIRPSVTEKLTSVPKPFEISFDHKRISGAIFITVNGTGFLVTRGAREATRVGPDRKAIGCGSSYNLVTGDISDKDERGRFCEPSEFDVALSPDDLLLLIRNTFSGPGLLSFGPGDSVFVGNFENGKRVGQGVLIDTAAHTFELQTWKVGEDTVEFPRTKESTTEDEKEL